MVRLALLRAAERKEHSHLGADAVGGRHQHRIAPAPGVVEGEQAAEATERGSRGVTLLGVDPHAETPLGSLPQDLVAGRFLSGADDRGLVLGASLARRLETGLGKRVVIMSQDPHNNVADRGARVVGIYRARLSGTEERFLYHVLGNDRAMRYGVGIGREGFAWSGRAIVQWKQKWPKWTPPEDMIARQPELERYSAANGGMPPGLDNPLGARALYIFQNGEDTLYRLHGSPEYRSIGKAVSSGCVRLINQDICDLYDRVPTRTPILVV